MIPRICLRWDIGHCFTVMEFGSCMESTRRIWSWKESNWQN
ncbi:hypothetical protein LARI1_G003594, partial [Lachnellula arida]